jgi:two-component system chemotaxis sensor kinase CheA
MSAEDQEMLSLFIQEAGEHLETLEADLLQLENNPRDAQRLNRIFRAAHSIKGTAGFFGLTPITDLAHVMESVMSLVRDGRMDATPAIISHLLTSTDKLKLMVAAPDRAGEVPTLEERQALQALLHLEPAPPAPPTPPALPECVRRFKLDPVLVGDALRHDQNLYVIDLRLHADVEAHGHTILDYLNEVVSLGSFIDSVTEVESNTGLGDTTPTDLHVALLFSTAMEPDLLLGAFNLPASQLTEVPLDPLRDWLKTQPTLVPASSAAGSAKAPTPVAPPPATAPAAAARASAPVPVAASAAVVVSSSPSSPAVIAPAVSTPTAVPRRRPRSRPWRRRCRARSHG